MIILGIESSCDDTAAAILESDGTLHASIISSQDGIHSRFGGVVPELASRQHMEVITTVVDETFSQADMHHDEIDIVAVTQGPGLIGSLLVGFSYAKSFAYTLGIPIVGVDHMAGHLLSAFLEEASPTFPYIALIVSGGTSSLFRVDSFFDFSLLGRTRDDAAGEAFDKVARLLGLGYPGGPIVARYSLDGDSSRFKLPRAWLEEGSLDFSFSGLKTAVMNTYNKNKLLAPLTVVPDLCAAFQDAVVDVLVEKTIRAANELNIESIVLGGGVSANNALRQRMGERCKDENRKLFLPALQNCTDNAAMIAYAGMKQYEDGVRGTMDDDVFSRSYLGQ